MGILIYDVMIDTEVKVSIRKDKTVYTDSDFLNIYIFFNVTFFFSHLMLPTILISE